MITEGNAHLSALSSLLALVLDEADRMVASGHFRELDKIIQYAYRCAREARRKQR